MLHFLTEVAVRSLKLWFLDFWQNRMSTLESAIEIAVSAHKGQTRKDGSPYILHPLRLMMSVQSESEKIVAILHDVVEDTDVTLAQIQQKGFSDEVVDALRLVTHNPSQTYDDYISDIARNPIATAVKLADLKDNSNLFEIPEPKAKDFERLEKYHKAFKRLTQTSKKLNSA